MRINSVLPIILAGSITLGLATAHAQNHLPPPCASIANPPPAHFHCPEPYVQLVSVGSDHLFDSAWHCRSTGQSLGTVDGSCGGGQGLAMFEADGWALPVQNTADATIDYRAEIATHVVHPCIIGIGRSHSDLASLSDDDLIGLMRGLRPDMWDEVFTATLPVVTGQDETTRMFAYQLFLRQCITSGTGG